jgi:MFS family permease
MPFVYNYPPSSSSGDEDTTATSTIFYKVTAATQLLWKDPKMKYMIGLNAVFGFAAAFLNSYVNGQVVPIALDNGEKYIGVLSSWVSAVAAGMSLVFGRLGPTLGKGPILILGAVCFFGVVFPFVVQPDASQYGWGLLILVYSFHGIGRATFEGTLKATFADYFPYEKEGAFANIILQNGLSGAIGYFCKLLLEPRWPYSKLLEWCSSLNPLVLTHLSFDVQILQ